MATRYQAVWLGYEPSNDNRILNDVKIQRRVSTAPDVWADVWHGVIEVDSVEWKAITGGALGANAKRQALEALIAAKALEKKIDTPDDVCLDLNGLFTGANALPDNIVIRA